LPEIGVKPGKLLGKRPNSLATRGLGKATDFKDQALGIEKVVQVLALYFYFILSRANISQAPGTKDSLLRLELFF